MRGTNTDFLNNLTLGFVEFYQSPSGGSLLVVDEANNAVSVTIPASYAFGCNNPTKELFDRLSELKARYSKPLFPDSISPNEGAFQNAKEFVLTLPLSRIVKPRIHVASDGEVNFHWSGSDFQIDLGFYGNGKFSFYGEKEGRNPILGDDVPVKDGIPESLVALAS